MVMVMVMGKLVIYVKVDSYRHGQRAAVHFKRGK